MKTAELTGALLDYWVARAEGLHIRRAGKAVWVTNNGFSAYIGGDHVPHYAPSTNWAQGGAIIDDNAIGFLPISDAEYQAEEYITCCLGRGPTPLVAAMRCYVQSKFGDEVEDSHG